MWHSLNGQKPTCWRRVVCMVPDGWVIVIPDRVTRAWSGGGSGSGGSGSGCSSRLVGVVPQTTSSWLPTTVSTPLKVIWMIIINLIQYLINLPQKLSHFHGSDSATSVLPSMPYSSTPAIDHLTPLAGGPTQLTCWLDWWPGADIPTLEARLAQERLDMAEPQTPAAPKLMWLTAAARSAASFSCRCSIVL